MYPHFPSRLTRASPSRYGPTVSYSMGATTAPDLSITPHFPSFFTAATPSA